MELAAGSLRSRALSSERVLSPRGALVGIVLVATGVHLVLALAQAVPLYFPDEYIYASLARSIAQTGHPMVHGAPAHFPALLEPLLAAPFWIGNNVELAYRLTDVLNAIAGSLAAIPLYLLARKLGLGTKFALATAALTAFRSSLFFGAFVLADPIAQPLVLAALYLAVCALSRPTTRNQLGFLAFAGLAAFARIEYLPLPLLLLVCALVFERGRVRVVVRNLRVTLVVIGVVLAAALAVRTPSAWLGYYGGVLRLSLGTHALARWYTSEVLLFSLGAGIVIVPAALVALARALRTREEPAVRAFALVAVCSALVVFGESALYSTNGSQSYEGRYLMALSPLLLPAFGLYGKLGRPRPRIVVALAALLLAGLLGMRPFHYAAGQHRYQSPLLIALGRLREVLGPGGSTAALTATIVVLSCAAAAAALRRRGVVPVALAATTCFSVLVTGGALSVDLANAANVKRTLFPAGLRWIDATRLRNVALLDVPGTARDPSLAQLFWNTSVTGVVRLPGALPIDSFASTSVDVARDGSLLVGRTVLRRPLLIDGKDDVVLLRGATRVAHSGEFSLWRPAPHPRLELMLLGRHADGWLGPSGAVLAWPDHPHERLLLRLSQPADAPTTSVRFATAFRRWSVTVPTGGTKTVGVCLSGPTELAFAGVPTGIAAGAPVMVVSAAPRIVRGC